MGTVVMPHVMSWALSSRHILYHGHYHCAAFCVTGVVVAWPRWASCCGHVCCVATVGVITPCCVTVGVVAWSWALSSHHVLYCGHYHCTAFCVAGTIITLCFVLRALLMHGHGGHRVVVVFVVWPRWVLSRCVVSWSGLLRGCGGCYRTMLCRGRNGCVM